jgi:hypothetical protein
MSIPIKWGKANYKEFIENVNGFEEDVFSTEAISLILTNLLPTPKEAAKSLIKKKFPFWSERHIELLADDDADVEQRDEEREKRQREKEERRAKRREEKKPLTPEEQDKKRKEREARSAKRKEERRKERERFKKAFGELFKQMLDLAIKMVDEIKQAAILLFTELMDISKRIIVLTGLVASSIPGIVGEVVLLNIPGAIKSTLELVSLYLYILRQIKKIIPFLLPFKLIPNVIPTEKLTPVSTVFNQFISLLRVYWVPLKLLNKLILDLMKFIGNLLNRKRLSIFRKATRRLKKLGHLYRFWFLHPQMKGKISIAGIEIPNPYFPGSIRGDFYPTDGDREYPCYAFEEDDLDEIQGLLDTFVVGFEGSTSNRVVAYRPKPVKLPDEFNVNFDSFENFDLEAIADELENVQIPELETDEGIDETYIYDIELPDGTIIKNISPEGIEYYRENYILKYMNSFTQSFQVAAQTI